MENVPARTRGKGVRHYFGMETGEKAREVLLWSLPFLCFLTLALAGLSYLVQLLNPLPLWVYVLAIFLSVAYLFLFMARLRQAGTEAHQSGGKDESAQDS